MTDRPTAEETTELHLLCQAANSSTAVYDVMRLGYAAREWLPRLLDLVAELATPAAAEAEIARLTTALATMEEAALRNGVALQRESREAMREACIEITNAQPYYPDTNIGMRQQWVKDQIVAAIRALDIPSPPAEETT